MQAQFLLDEVVIEVGEAEAEPETLCLGGQRMTDEGGELVTASREKVLEIDLNEDEQKMFDYFFFFATGFAAGAASGFAAGAAFGFAGAFGTGAASAAVCSSAKRR